MRRLSRQLLIGVPLAVVLLASGGTWVYIHFVAGDAPAPFSLDSNVTPTTSGSGAAADPTSLDGTWKVTSGSTAGYRVREVLFGQSAEAVGRTFGVTGQFVVTGTTVNSASLAVDLTTVASNEARRDNQFKTRIMNVSSYPTARFKLTQPIELGAIPALDKTFSVNAVGDLTIHGETKHVTVALNGKRSASGLSIQGSVPVVFADYDIPAPSFGPAQVENAGTIEFLLLFSH